MELVNLGQSFMIGADDQMYQKDLDVACVVRSSNLAQELGMVSNIFSDKTGTLTRNEMKFVKFMVNNVLYDVGTDEIPDMDGMNMSTTPGYRSSNNLLVELKNRSIRHEMVYEFLRCLTTCHTVIREKDGTYRAESPDELALVQGVGNFDCFLCDRGTSTMMVEMLGEKQAYEILAVNAFNSDRKRMSILIREKASGEYYIMCKGADSTMLDLCDFSDSDRRSTDKALYDLACMGLRTLVIAHRKLDPDTAINWLNKHKAAASAVQNRSELLAAAGAEIERHMVYLGTTAIEDRLQDEVPEVIADLARAGIVLWMLTGDKEETAINIGHSCNLLLADTKVHFLTRINTPLQYAERLREVYDDVSLKFIPGQGYRNDDGNFTEFCLVMDGPSFEHFDVTDVDQRMMLLKVGQACRSVIACRLTPIQKQQVVNLVKVETVPRATCLSIGDGANDVSMIREADVGVGIFGKEGRQAANNADMAIGEFKFLRRLLLVHGRWNYIRQSNLFLYCMHKNMVVTLTLFWYW